ncbi:hypothetical protein [Paraburkholderia sp. SG-MS1]|uniref:hypothetical protein n=1 Tax=Paraburkholderia sp. SG-MS1 TaxID=2023741 RepID=UPI0014459B72|nr:hypothetical protein [Paraburkholderia sp. SG-MS1]
MQPQGFVTERSAKYDARFAIFTGFWQRFGKPTKMAAKTDGMHFEVDFIRLAILAPIVEGCSRKHFQCVGHIRFSERGIFALLRAGVMHSVGALTHMTG